jgi:hypothetical protein
VEPPQKARRLLARHALGTATAPESLIEPVPAGKHAELEGLATDMIQIGCPADILKGADNAAARRTMTLDEHLSLRQPRSAAAQAFNREHIAVAQCMVDIGELPSRMNAVCTHARQTLADVAQRFEHAGPVDLTVDDQLAGQNVVLIARPGEPAISLVGP